MYAVTSMPPEMRTRATLRSAEFGFFGVVVYTRVHTPRRCGAATFFLRPLPDLRPGVDSFFDFGVRPLRTSWLVVGMRRVMVANRGRWPGSGGEPPPVGPRVSAMRTPEGPDLSWGVLTREELRAAGLSDTAIARRVASGALHRMYRNVYSVAPPALLRPEARWRGAVLACGEGAALSHRSAAVFWELLEDRWAFVDVTTPRRGRKGNEGIRLHRTR